MHVPATLHDGNIAIGNKRDLFGAFRPKVVVLHDHQLVTTAEFILAVEHLVTDALVVDIRAFVAAGDDDGLVEPHPAVTTGQRLYEFVARYDTDIGKALEADLGQ